MLPYSHHLLDLLQPKPTKQHDAHQFRLLDVQLALLVFTSIVAAIDNNLQWFNAIVSSCQQSTDIPLRKQSTDHRYDHEIIHIDPPHYHLVKPST